MADLGASKRLLEGVRLRGEFDDFMLPLRLHYQALRVKLEHYTLKRILKDKDWPELQHLQGQAKACLDLIKQYDQLATPAVEQQPKARPSMDA